MKRVLEEENYEKAIEKIIKRDYFPNVSILELKIKLEKAITEGKLKLAEEIKKSIKLAEKEELSQEEIIRIQNSNSEENFIPVLQKKQDQNKSKFGKNEWENDEVEKNEIQSVKINTNVSIDQFLHNYTSEDNVSFNKIFQKDQKRRKKEMSKMIGLALEEPDEDIKMIEQKRNEGIEGKEIVLVGQPKKRMKQKKIFSPLMFFPDTIEKRDKTIKDDQKVIVRENTRFTEGKLHKLMKEEVPKISQKKKEIFEINKKWGTTTDEIGDYLERKRKREAQSYDLDDINFLENPEIKPTKENVPITWGTVSQIENVPKKTGFKIQKTSKRERIGLILSENVSKKKKRQTTQRRTTIKSSFAPYTPISGIRSILTPRGKELAMKIQKKKKKSKKRR